MRELPIEDFAYTVRSTWPIAQALFDERDHMPLPDWSVIPGGKPVPSPLPLTPLLTVAELPLFPRYTRDARWEEQVQFIRTLVEPEAGRTLAIESV